MARFLGTRLLSSFVVFLGVSLVVFLILHLTPGDPARLMLPEGASEADIQALREALGLNRPLHVQFGVFLGNALRGNLGTSLYYKQPNLEIILSQLPMTLLLSFAAMGLGVAVGVPLGILSAVKRGSVLDQLGMFLALLGQAMSPVWLGILLMYVFAVQLRMLPPFGAGTVKHLIMPAVTLGAPLIGLITRLTRAGMLEVLGKDFIRTAHAKGLSLVKVVGKHALKNTLIPLITVVGLQLGTLLGGAVVTETIFAWPGVGRLAMAAILARDFPLVQALVLIVSMIFVFINLVVDVTYGFLDPRLRYG